jgi:hypothetical protein
MGFRSSRGQSLEVQYPYRELRANDVKFGDTVTFDLDAYEQLVAELQYGESAQYHPNPQVGGTANTEISFTPTAVQKDASDLKLSTTVEVPVHHPKVRFAVLLEPDQEIRGLRADAMDAGKPLAISTENGGRGIWYWFWADLTPGKHSIELTIHSAAPAHISAWLLTRRNLGTPAARGQLPAQSNIGGTHLLLEETIR